MSQWRRMPDKRSTETTREEHDHAAGLAKVAPLLTQPSAYAKILAAGEKGRLDRELQQQALNLTKPAHGTSAQLRLSRDSALRIFFQLAITFEERWDDPLRILDDIYDEDDYGRLQDHLQALADMAGALAHDACKASAPAEPEQAAPGGVVAQ